MTLLHVHAFLTVVGGLVGVFLLKTLDEGLWDRALLKGAMLPDPTPRERLIFLALCTLFPEIAIAACLALFLFARGNRD